MLIAGKMNESTELSEALKLAPVAYQGGKNDKPFPDGSAKGDMVGNNGVIEVNVTYAGKGWSPKGDYVVEAYFTGDDNEEATMSLEFKTGKSAIQFAEKLLKEVNDPLYEPKKVAKKYKMEYVTM